MVSSGREDKTGTVAGDISLGPLEKVEHLSANDRGMVENLVRFANLLRGSGFKVGLSSVVDAAMGLDFIDPADMKAFETLLTATFVSSGDELARFRELFEDFWLGKQPKSVREEDVLGILSSQKVGSSVPQILSEKGSALGQIEVEQGLRAYSPMERRSPVRVNIKAGDRNKETIRAMKLLLRVFATRPSRRMIPSPLGSRFSLRRTLRKSLQHGGNLIYLEFTEPRIRKNLVLLLCDVSGSMEEHGRLALELAYVLLGASGNSEVFFFSTDLVRVTPLLKRWPMDNFVHKISEVMAQWGAGTRIGHCLRSLRRRFGTSLLSKRPLVLFLSDGWDQGDIDILGREMELLKKRARAIVWFNPLLSTPGYEPTCRGMAKALPYLDHFLPLNDVEELPGLVLRFRDMKSGEWCWK